jgi:beta-glucosidase
VLTSYRFGTYSVSDAVNAGLDLEMPGPSIWRGNLIKYAASGRKITDHTMDERVRNVLNFVNKAIATGIPENAEEGTVDTKETSALLRKIAAESVVLLKNERNILPLSKSKSVSLALFNPFAQD